MRDGDMSLLPLLTLCLDCIEDSPIPAVASVIKQRLSCQLRTSRPMLKSPGTAKNFPTPTSFSRAARYCPTVRLLVLP